jgi:WD40 repeat protein
VLLLAVDWIGDLILSGSKDLTARISSISSGQMLYTVKGHTNSIITVAYNSRRNMFCTGSGDRSVKIWSIIAEDVNDWSWLVKWLIKAYIWMNWGEVEGWDDGRIMIWIWILISFTWSSLQRIKFWKSLSRVLGHCSSLSFDPSIQVHTNFLD